MKRNLSNIFEQKYINLTKEIVLKHIGSKIEVFLFGSRANGTNTQFSDIDVGFVSQKKIESYIFRKITEEIEDSRIPYHVDLIDFFDVDEGFRKQSYEGRVFWNKIKS